MTYALSKHLPHHFNVKLLRLSFSCLHLHLSNRRFPYLHQVLEEILLCDGEEYVNMTSQEQKTRSGWFLGRKYIAAVEKQQWGVNRRWGYRVVALRDDLDSIDDIARLQHPQRRPKTTIDLSNDSSTPSSRSRAKRKASSSRTKKKRSSRAKRRKPPTPPPSPSAASSDEDDHDQISDHDHDQTSDNDSDGDADYLDDHSEDASDESSDSDEDDNNDDSDASIDPAYESD